MAEHNIDLRKYLGILFYAQAAAMVLTVINAVSNLDSITAWVSKLLTAAAIWSLFQLRAANPRYRKSAVCKALVLVYSLLVPVIMPAALAISSIAALVVGIASWIGAYQEYHGHGELIADQDAKLAKKWNNLFLVEVLVGLGISFLSTTATTLMVIADALSGTVTTVIIALSTVTGLVLNGLYLYYMKRTLALTESEM